MIININIPDSIKEPAAVAGALSQIAAKMDASTIVAIGMYCAKQTDIQSFNKKLASKLRLGGIIK